MREMFAEGYRIYVATRKKNDQLFNHYLMRPIAGVVVAVLSRTPTTPNQITLLNLILFIVGAALLPLLPSWQGGLIAVFVIEISYLLDCVDGMLARHKKLASKTGHLFDFFTDEVKASLLVVGVGLRLVGEGGYGPIAERPFVALWQGSSFWPVTLAALFIVSQAIALTKFQRTPEMSGKAQSVEAYYETVDRAGSRSLIRTIKDQVFTFLRFLNHYPSHLYIFALFGRFDAFLWMYVSLNALYLTQGWLGLVLRFGRFRSSDVE